MGGNSNNGSSGVGIPVSSDMFPSTSVPSSVVNGGGLNNTLVPSISGGSLLLSTNATNNIASGNLNKENNNILWWTSSSGGVAFNGGTKGRGVQKYLERFPHALLENTKVWAKDVKQNIWRRATIISVREPRMAFVDDQLVSVASSSLVGFADSSWTWRSYEYYVNWTGYDRRMDSWVPAANVLLECEGAPNSSASVEWQTPEQPGHDHDGIDHQWLKDHEENTKVKTIMNLRMGPSLVPTWYFSPLPREFHGQETLHVCEFCLSLFREGIELEKHSLRCNARCPPGDEIYRDGNIAMFEVDGHLSRLFCENLCYISKLFLDHKTLRHTVTLFLYYVLCDVDEKGYHIVGYFSKEKFSRNNLSCILTLPQHQRKGYGKFLIAFSYALSLIERRRGTPERPLSDLGKASYMAYWAQQLLPLLKQFKQENQPITIEKLSDLTAIEPADVQTCLDEFGILRSIKGKDFFWLPDDLYERVYKLAGKPSKPVRFELIHWTPYDSLMFQFEFPEQLLQQQAQSQGQQTTVQ